VLLPAQGYGFAPLAPGAPLVNLVYIPVPRSSTFPSDVAACSVTAANATTITCITRAHLAADVSAADPNALLVQPRPSPPALLRLALCEAGLTGVDALVCAFEAQTPVAGCSAADLSSCRFSYSWSATAHVEAALPGSGEAGMELLLLGSNLDGVVKVSRLLQLRHCMCGVCVTGSAQGIA
jgi:hypothetical protein